MLILLLIGSGISHIYVQSHRDDFKWDIKTETVYIKTLSDNTAVMSGSFVLGSGTISSDSYYFFYVIVNDSTFYLDRIKADNAKIIETNIKNAYYQKRDFTIPADQRMWLLSGDNLSTEYYIYVPKGTIIVNYNLDTQ